MSANSTTTRTDAGRHLYRDQLEVIVNILKQCEEPGANISKISEASHLSLPRAKPLIEKMVANRTLRISNKGPRRYIITSNGKQLQNSIITSMNMLEGRERQDIRRKARKDKTSQPINIW